MGFLFEGKKVLVTGGAGGLGLSIVQKFYESGATVYALDYNQELLNELKEKFPKVNAIYADLENWDATKKIIRDLGPLDHLVNNAGVFGALELVPDVTHKNLDRIMNTNFKAPFNISQEFAKNVIANSLKGSTIVNISSPGGRIASSGTSSYSCSKAALEMLTKCLAVELGAHDIRVNAILPTAMMTPLFSSIPPEVLASARGILDRAPIKGVLDTGDAANLVLYLSSPLSKMITGVGVPIDGGLLVT